MTPFPSNPVLQAALALAQFRMPGENDPYVRPAGDTSPKYIEWLEANAQVLYPAIGLLVLMILVVAILQAWRAPQVSGASMLELKREILVHLRKEMGGCSADALGKVVALDSFKLVKLLEQMQNEGMVRSYTNTHRLTIWQIRGLGSEPP